MANRWRHDINYVIIVFGWWLSHPSENYEFASWDDEIPKWIEKNMFQTTNQMVHYIHLIDSPVMADFSMGTWAQSPTTQTQVNPLILPSDMNFSG